MKDILILDKNIQTVLISLLGISLFSGAAMLSFDIEAQIEFSYGAACYFYNLLGLVQVISLCTTYKLKKVAAPKALIFYFRLLLLLVIGAIVLFGLVILYFIMGYRNNFAGMYLLAYQFALVVVPLFMSFLYYYITLKAFNQNNQN